MRCHQKPARGPIHQQQGPSTSATAEATRGPCPEASPGCERAVALSRPSSARSSPRRSGVSASCRPCLPLLGVLVFVFATSTVTMCCHSVRDRVLSLTRRGTSWHRTVHFLLHMLMHRPGRSWLRGSRARFLVPACFGLCQLRPGQGANDRSASATLTPRRTPTSVCVADLAPAHALDLPGALVGTRHQAGIRQEVAHLREPADGVDLVQHRQPQDRADAGDRLQESRSWSGRPPSPSVCRCTPGWRSGCRTP